MGKQYKLLCKNKKTKTTKKNYYVKWSGVGIQMLGYASNTLLIATNGCKEPCFYFNEDIQLCFKNKIMKSLKINNTLLAKVC